MITVVIPLYNKENAIAHTLSSVLAQTYTDYECIVIDDGSTDNSADVARRIACGDKRFKIISKKNGGVSSARNMGVQEAHGDFVAFLDGDDLWEPIYLEEMVRLIQDFPDASIYGAGLGELCHGVKKTAYAYLPYGFRGLVNSPWTIEWMMLAYTSSSVCVPIEFARKTLANECLTHGEDLDVWLRLMLQGNCVFYEKTLAYYVKDAENRAMINLPAIDKHIVSVVYQYEEARRTNAAFRKSFDTQMLYYLYPYLFSEYKTQALHIARTLDFSQMKWTMKFRIYFPRIYRLVKGH